MITSLSRISLKYLSQSRRISTQFTISPEAVEAIYEGSNISPTNIVPNSQRIKHHQKKLQQFYQESSD